MEPKAQDPIKVINVMIRVKNAFFQLWPVLMIAVIVCSAFSVIRGKQSFVPMYEAKAIFTVDSTYEVDDVFGTSAYYDQYAAQEVAAAFPYILNTDMMDDMVVEVLPKGYANGYPHAETVVDTNMLVLTVQSTDPQDAYDYLVAIIECYPSVLEKIVEGAVIKVMTPPSVPTAPYNSFSPLGTAVKGGAVGALAALAFIFACGLLTRTVQTADELKSAINLPILVALPKVNLKKRRTGTPLMVSAGSDPNMAESLRGLRLKVKKLLEDKERKTVLVTSTLAGEGKSTVALNLAKSLVRDGHKVVILDADLRSQSIARMLGEMAVGNSLLDCLKDPELSILDCVRTDKTGALHFISGRSTDKRHYSIEHRAMHKIIDILAAEYDYVVIDTPPSEVVSDATALCRYADCVLYVVKQDYAKRSQVINAITSLHQKDVKIAGCVFNGVPQFHRQYGYGYRSSYGYGYDYGYRKYSGYGSKYGYGYSKYASNKEKEDEE